MTYEYKEKENFYEKSTECFAKLNKANYYKLLNKLSKQLSNIKNRYYKNLKGAIFSALQMTLNFDSLLKTQKLEIIDYCI